MKEEEKLYLGFIHFIGLDSDGLYEYEFIFTDNVDEFWGEDFNEKPAGLVNNLMPEEQYVTQSVMMKLEEKLNLIQDNCCFSISDALDGCVAIAWSGNFIFRFGDEYDDVRLQFANNNIVFHS